MEQYYRREFVLRVMFTLGLNKLSHFIGMASEDLYALSMGNSEITDSLMDRFYNALASG